MSPFAGERIVELRGHATRIAGKLDAAAMD